MLLIPDKKAKHPITLNLKASIMFSEAFRWLSSLDATKIQGIR